MRIISGNFKKKKLILPDPKVTRPLRDYIKESLFNLLAHSKLLNFKISQSTILDIFSGSGSFGIECLSRGSSKVFFIEKEKKIIEILKKNLQNDILDDNYKIFNQDFTNINLKNSVKDKIDLVFIDPPFKFNFFKEIFIKLKDLSEQIAQSIIIVHYENKNNFVFDKYLNIIIKKNYGRSVIIFAKIKN